MSKVSMPNANKNIAASKVRLSDGEKDAYYEYWWRRGDMRPKRAVWVSEKDYAMFKKNSKSNTARTTFLSASG